MARIPELVINDAGGSTGNVEVRSAQIQMKANQGTTADLGLLFPEGYALSDVSDWTLIARYQRSRDGSAPPSPKTLLRHGWLVESSRREATGTRETNVRLLDGWSAFKAISVPSAVHYTNTTSHLELRRVAEWIGTTGRPKTNLPDFTIARHDYSPDSAALGTLTPYMDPYDPWLFVDPDEGILMVMDILAGVNDPEALSITPDNAVEVSFNEERYDYVNRVRHAYRLFAGEGDSSGTTATERRTEPIEYTDEQGNRYVSWEVYADLHENPADGAEVTREVLKKSVKEVYQSTSGVLSPALRDTVEMEYEGDYTRLRRTTETRDGLVDLPYEGRVYKEGVRVTAEDITWTADPDNPRRHIRKSAKGSVSGIVLYSGETIGPDAVLADVATLNGGVDTSATSRQRYAVGVLAETTTTDYRIAHDRAVIIPHVVVWDALRRVVKWAGAKPALSRDSVSQDTRAIVEYIPGTFAGPDRPRAAFSIDSTRIGRDEGRRLALRKLALTRRVKRSMRVRLLWPDLKFGVLSAPTVSGFGSPRDGRYVVEAITYTYQAAKGRSEPVARMELSLVSP